jgi:hypothetical protein
MPKTRKSIAERLNLACTAIANTLDDPALQSTMIAFGYTPERLREGLALREAAQALCQRQHAAYGDLYAATDALDAAKRRTHANYMRIVGVARVALGSERGGLQMLGLQAQRKRDLAGWLLQAQQFSANALANAAALERLAVFGITPELLAAGAREVEMVAACYAAQRKQRGVARSTTRQRDAAIAALDAWMGDFIKIARLALRDQPPSLKKMGVVA